MGKYVVKAGENIYDVALNLYGGIEGLFDLMASNTDAINQTGLSLKDSLQPGTQLSYTDDFSVNPDIVGWFQKNNIKVRNGEHIYIRYDIGKYAISYAKKYNLSIVENAFKIWPAMKTYSFGETDEKTINDFLKYINEHCIWANSITESDIPTIRDGDYLFATELSTPDHFYMPKMIIKQVGKISTFIYNLKSNRMMVIDWGDNTMPEMCNITNSKTTVEHCYEDASTHIIRIYGDISFSMLDLRGIGGTYYPLSEIQVSGDFYSDLQTNETINRLIIRT